MSKMMTSTVAMLMGLKLIVENNNNNNKYNATKIGTFLIDKKQKTKTTLLFP